MKYYKWIYESRPSICRVPGFAYLDKAHAISMHDEFISWVGNNNLSRPYLFEFDGVEPLRFPINFSSVLMIVHNKDVIAQALPSEDIKRTIKEFETLADDYFTTAISSDHYVKLFHKLANTVGCLKSGNAKWEEVYYAWPCKMTQISNI